jgi:hypothetical protein
MHRRLAEEPEYRDRSQRSQLRPERISSHGIETAETLLTGDRHQAPAVGKHDQARAGATARSKSLRG